MSPGSQIRSAPLATTTLLFTIAGVKEGSSGNGLVRGSCQKLYRSYTAHTPRLETYDVMDNSSHLWEPLNVCLTLFISNLRNFST
jgi:hypothetical protein